MQLDETRPVGTPAGLPLHEGRGLPAGLVAQGNYSAVVSIEATGISYGGERAVVRLGFTPEAIEAWADDLKRVAQEARAERAHWKTCSECRGWVPLDHDTWPECAHDCCE